MYVKIGKYPSRLTCSLFSNYMTNKHGHAWHDSTTRVEAFVEKLDDIIQSAYNIINWAYFDRLERKVKVRIDPSDTWSLDSTLALIVTPMLRQLKNTQHGAPEVDKEDVPEELRASGDTFLMWDYVLNEMIWAFEQKLVDGWEASYFEVTRAPESPFGVSLTLLDKEGLAAHQDRMTNGFRLFGKYYEGLWD